MGADDFVWGGAGEHLKHMAEWGAPEVIDLTARKDIAVLQAQHDDFLRCIQSIQGTLNNIFVAVVGGILVASGTGIVSLALHH